MGRSYTVAVYTTNQANNDFVCHLQFSFCNWSYYLIFQSQNGNHSPHGTYTKILVLWKKKIQDNLQTDIEKRFNVYKGVPYLFVEREIAVSKKLLKVKLLYHKKII